MRYTLFWLILLYTGLLSGQSFTQDIEVKEYVNSKQKLLESSNLDLIPNKPIDALKNTDFTLTPKPILLDTVSLFISFSAAIFETNGKRNNTSLSIRFSTNNLAWDEWITLTSADHAETSRYTQATTILYLDKNYHYYQLKAQSNLLHEGNNCHAILLNFYNPDKIYKACTGSFNQGAVRRNTASSCTCYKPTYLSRPVWNCVQQGVAANKSDITHIIIHHSGGPNTSPNWEANVLSIWDAHVTTYGYADIGYHWLIDPNGNIYEGRSVSIGEALGNHFCNEDEHTLGICMLGTYEEKNITDKARNALQQLLAWKCCELSLNPDEKAVLEPSGLLLERIAGHQQGCTTPCPGTTLFGQLPSIRSEVKSKLKTACFSTHISAETASFSFSCFPNPSGNNLNLQAQTLSNLLYSYSIFSSDGRTILSYKSVTNREGLNVSVDHWENIKPGIYMLKFQLADQIIYKKIIKN